MVVVVGGHARKIGKTSVICGVIRALPGWNWTAIKISPHADPEEIRPSAATDSGRFLAAGAARAVFLKISPGELDEALPQLFPLVAASENAIIESNSILRVLNPDLCAMVLDFSVADLKSSSLWFLEKANVLVTTSALPFACPRIPETLLKNKPRFSALPPLYQNAAFIEEIKLRKTGPPTLKTPAASADPGGR